VQSAVESVQRAQVAVEAFVPATCAKCGDVMQGHLRSHCDSVTGLRRQVARLVARRPELGAVLAQISVRSVDVWESSEEHVRVAMRVELRSDPWHLDARGRVAGSWLDVVCEYSDPEWDSREPRMLVAFGREACALSSSRDEDLPLLVSDAELALICELMDPVAASEIERVRERAIAEEAWER